jgi:Uri superfamily endonuclease
MNVSESENLAVAPGAYALIIRLDKSVADLPPGCYLYAGSAYGPGGIRARVRRHLTRTKSLHWHVDRLTNSGQVISVIPIPGGHECEIIAVALRLPGVRVPVLGFGSSDCRMCPAHLLQLPDEFEAENVTPPTG